MNFFLVSNWCFEVGVGGEGGCLAKSRERLATLALIRRCMWLSIQQSKK